MGFFVRLRNLAVFLAVCAICAAPNRVSASTVLYRTDAQLIAMSERVVHGRVMSQRTTKAGPDGETIYTVTTLQIIEDLTGVSGATIENLGAWRRIRERVLLRWRSGRVSRR